MAGLQIPLMVLTMITAAAYFIAFRKGSRKAEMITRPLTTLLLVLVALAAHTGSLSVYQVLVVNGLLLFLLNDLAAFLPKGQTQISAVASASALILFTIAFAWDPGPYLNWEILVPVAACALVVLVVILRNTVHARLPVIVFAILLSLMMWQAAGRAWYLAHAGVAAAFYGAVMLLLSYTLRAYHHYVRSFNLAPYLHQSIYWLSLCCIALSV